LAKEANVGRLVTARQAADELGVVERTVRRWIGAGDLPAEKQGGAFVIDLEAAREVHRRSRAGRAATASTELAELRGRYLEVRGRLAEVEQELAEERRRSARLLAIVDPHAATRPEEVGARTDARTALSPQGAVRDS
jgi:excisionase family DNA binding protein